MEYTYENLLGEVVDSERFEDVANNLTIRTAINRGVRGVVREVDLKSMKRKAALARVFENIYDYTCPTDLKALIDLQPQSDRDSSSRVTFTTEEQFDRKKEIQNLVTISYDDMTRKIRSSLDVADTSISISDGTWALFGDAENVVDMTFDISSGGTNPDTIVVDINEADWAGDGSLANAVGTYTTTSFTATMQAYVGLYITGNTTTIPTVILGVLDRMAVLSNGYLTSVEQIGLGNGKIRTPSFGGTTAGIQNSTITDFDLTGYTSIFVWANITSPTDITNYILRIGNDASNYYSITTTTQADGNAFVEGKNLLQFDLSDKAETGTVTETTCDYVVLYMTKAAGKISEKDYGFSDLQIHTGQLMNALYYTKFGFQTSAGVYIENSTADTDYINADTEEFDLFVQYCRVQVMRELKEFDLMKLSKEEYDTMKKSYMQHYPSERLLLTQKYY